MKGLPAQRHIWVAATERKSRERMRCTSMEVTGDLVPSNTAHAQMLEGMERPMALMDAEDTHAWTSKEEQEWNHGSNSGARSSNWGGGKSVEAKASDATPNRVSLTGELYKVIPRLTGLRASCSADNWGEAAKKDLSETLNTLRGQRDKLDTTEGPMDEEFLKEVRDALTSAVLLEKRVMKAGVLKAK